MLQPLPNGQPTAETSKHKFLVQTCFVPAGETNIDAIVRLNLFKTSFLLPYCSGKQ
jgi:hypothetical protein